MLLIERAKLLQKAKKDAFLRQSLKIQCKEDIFFWIENFVWIYEPRKKGDKKIPMSMKGNFRFQKRIVRKILECIEEGKDLRIEKSRDMGLSWLIIVIFVWGWLFRGWDTLIGSKTAEAVDKLNNMKTLFPKARFVLKNLPKWILPRGFNIEKHAGWMNIVNPEMGCSISGEANSPTFATGSRAKAIAFDEFAKWEHTDRDAWTSAGAATPCRIANSTPKYKNNKFFELKGSGIEEMSIHYSENPGKGEEWVKKTKPRFTEQEWEQEMEINYSGTARAVVFAEELTYLQQHLRFNEKVKYLETKPVYISMDLGMGDLTTVLCWQVLGYSEEIRLFDYYENSNQSIYHYIEWIKSPDRPWNKQGKKYHEGWRDIVVIPDPNQATNRELTSGKSIEQIFRDAEIQIEMRWIGEIEGISIAKKMMKRLWIKPDLLEILGALEGWHYDFDNKRQEFKPHPVHTKDSHACKAIIYFAAWLEEPEDYKEEDLMYVPDFSEGTNTAGI